MVPRWPSWMEHHQRVMQACGGTLLALGGEVRLNARLQKIELK